MINRSLLVSFAFLVSCASSEGSPGGAADEGTTVTLVQRRTLALPTEELSLRIGDITRGQVRAELLQKDGTALIAQSMRVGDALPYAVVPASRTIGLVHLENNLLGDDFAVFHLGTAEQVGSAQIASMTHRVHRSSLPFREPGTQRPVGEVVEAILGVLAAAETTEELFAPDSRAWDFEVRVRDDLWVKLPKWLRSSDRSWMPR